MTPRKLDKDDIARGFVSCGLCDLVHLTKARVVNALPNGYHGELCPRCNLWVYRRDMIGTNKETSK